MKYYHVEKNGTILAIEARRNWIPFPGWRKSLEEAIEETRRNLQVDIDQAQYRLLDRQNRLENFKRGLKENNHEEISTFAHPVN